MPKLLTRGKTYAPSTASKVAGFISEWRPTSNRMVAGFASEYMAGINRNPQSDRNVIDFYADGGLSFQGLVPGRPDDQFAFLGALTKISSQARAADFDANFYNRTFAPVRRFEAVAEATYSAKLASGVLMQPNIQYVIRPGGGIVNPTKPFSTHAMSNALVLGVRTTIQY